MQRPITFFRNKALADVNSTGDAAITEHTINSGKFTLLLNGTGSVAGILQITSPDGDWVDYKTSLGEGGHFLELPACRIRVYMSGGTASLGAWLLSH